MRRARRKHESEEICYRVRRVSFRSSIFAPVRAVACCSPAGPLLRRGDAEHADLLPGGQPELSCLIMGSEAGTSANGGGCARAQSCRTRETTLHARRVSTENAAR